MLFFDDDDDFLLSISLSRPRRCFDDDELLLFNKSVLTGDGFGGSAATTGLPFDFSSSM